MFLQQYFQGGYLRIFNKAQYFMGYKSYSTKLLKHKIKMKHGKRPELGPQVAQLVKCQDLWVLRSTPSLALSSAESLLRFLPSPPSLSTPPPAPGLPGTPCAFCLFLSKGKKKGREGGRNHGPECRCFPNVTVLAEGSFRASWTGQQRRWQWLEGGSSC